VVVDRRALARAPRHRDDAVAEGLAAGGAEVDFVALDSPQGHDSFLVDVPRFGEPIARLLASL
jgi:homoserine acetyltransferase